MKPIDSDVRTLPKTARLAVLLGIAVATLGVGRPAIAQTTTCDFGISKGGGIVYPDQNFLNVYWSPNWNTANVSNVGNPAIGGPYPTMDAIDAFTQALIDSTYFQTAASDYGIGVPKFLGSVFETTVALPPGNVDVPTMSSEVDRIVANHFTDVKPLSVNLFLPAGNIPRDLLFRPICQNDNRFGAFHTTSASSGTPYTVIPLDSQCNPSFAAAMESLSHEMVESTTDASGIAWSNVGIPPIEVADVCATMPPGISGHSGGPFLMGSFGAYYSNSLCSCTPGWTGASTDRGHLPLSLAPDGSVQFQLSAADGNFGSLPPEFPTPTATNPLAGNTPYVWLTAASGSSGPHDAAGNSFDAGGDPRGVSLTAYSNTLVEGYVTPFFDNCDTVQLQVWNPADGSTSTAHARWGSAQSITMNTPSTGLVDVLQNITGVLLDENGIPVAGATVSLQVIPSLGHAFTATTNSAGVYDFRFTPTAPVKYRVTASATSCDGTAVSQTELISVSVSSGCSMGGRANGTGLGSLIALIVVGVALLRRRLTRPTTEQMDATKCRSVRRDSLRIGV